MDVLLNLFSYRLDLTLTAIISAKKSTEKHKSTEKSARLLQERCKESRQWRESPTKTFQLHLLHPWLHVPHVVSTQPAPAAVIKQQEEPFSHIHHPDVTAGAPRGRWYRKLFLSLFFFFFEILIGKLRCWFIKYSKMNWTAINWTNKPESFCLLDWTWTAIITKWCNN